MSATNINRQILLASRPKGMVKESDFLIHNNSIPTIKDGQVLVQTLYLTVDPYMRGRMNDGPSYIEPFSLNKPISGGFVGQVKNSKSSQFNPGEYVYGFSEWSDYSAIDAKGLRKLDATKAPISTALGVLGMPGLTAYIGLLDIGQPKEGETVLISGAAGAVGSIVGQIAKIKGCRVIGLAGSDEKVDYLVNNLGFDVALNYKNPDFSDQLKLSCKDGIDIYYDNVGGDITDHALKLINKNARVVICGQISMYNLAVQDIGPRNWWLLLIKSALAKGFIVSDYENRFPEGINQISQWIQQGKIKYTETIVEGLENAPKAFLGLFKGENIGKQLVKVFLNC